MTTPTLIRCQCGEMLIDDGGNSHYNAAGRWLHYLEPKGGRADKEGSDGPNPPDGEKAPAVRSPTSHAPVPERSEKEIQRGIRRALLTLGYRVNWLSQPRTPNQTAGLGDLYIQGHGRTAWIEVKRPGEDQTPAQREFEAAERANGGTYLVWRSESDALAWHERRGAA